MSRFLPADHAKGDESTIGGYEAVHGRPAALDAIDGFAYSVAILSDETRAADQPAYGAYLIFLRWRRVGEEGVEGHIETDFLERAESRDAALQLMRDWPIAKVQEVLNAQIALRPDPRDAAEDADPA